MLTLMLFYLSTINLSNMMTVYGFSQDRLIERKTCFFDITISQDARKRVNVQITADALVGDQCLHRDIVEKQPLEEETE